MTRPEPAELERLRRRLRELQRENEALTDKAEELLLLGLVSEKIALEASAAGVIAITLESVVILKEIAYAAYISVGEQEAVVQDDFGLNLAWSARDRRFCIDEELASRLERGWFGRLPQDAAALPLFTEPLGDRPANAFYWAPLADGVRRPDNPCPKRRGYLLFVNSVGDIGYLEGLLPLLDRIRDVVSGRLEVLALLEAIRSINRDLEATVAARTEELRQSEQRHRSVLESASDAIISLSAEGLVTSWNAGARSTFGYEADEIIGQSVEILAPPEQRAQQPALLQTVAREGMVLGHQTERVARDGSRVPVEMNLSALRDERGGLNGYCGVIRDISERRRAAAAQQELQRQLMQSQRMESVGKLAGGIAHDFNNLLTGIQGFIEIALDELPSTSPVHEDLLEARSASERAVELTRQLLLFGRREPADLRLVDLNSSVQALRKMLDRIIGERYTLTTALADGLWSIRADAGHLDQVLMNLVINARDAMPDGGEILISSRNRTLDGEAVGEVVRSGRFVELAVVDAGVGIEADNLSQIFEPFFTTKARSGGSGLGLSVVYGIVTQHGGWIDVASTPGEGTTIRVFVPAAENRASVQLKEPAPDLRDAGRGERVLIVEDEAVVRNLIEQSLSRYGYDVVATESAERALTLFDQEEGRFQLVISDVGLPGMDGVSLVERLRRQRPELKIVLATGYSSETNWSAMRSLGWPVLKKPFRLKELLRTVRQVLDAEGEPAG